ncbi:MAG: O-antigen ligase family protein [bacterium]
MGTGVIFLVIIVTLSIYILRGGGLYRTGWQKIYEDRPIWKEYWQSILEKPWWGLGWGINPRNIVHGHNLYLSNAAQMGILSVFLVLAFYALLVYNASQTAQRIRDPQLKAILLGSTATFLGHLIYNLTDIGGILVDFSATSMTFFAYILLAVPLAINHIYRRQEKNEFHE